jgi:hypothetical protein
MSLAIFKKDVLHTRSWLLFWFMLLAIEAFFSLSGFAIEGESIQKNMQRQMVGVILYALEWIAAYVLIALVVQEDELVSKKSEWLTMPISRNHMLLSKFALIFFAVVLVPGIFELINLLFYGFNTKIVLLGTCEFIMQRLIAILILFLAACLTKNFQNYAILTIGSYIALTAIFIIISFEFPAIAVLIFGSNSSFIDKSIVSTRWLYSTLFLVIFTFLLIQNFYKSTNVGRTILCLFPLGFIYCFLASFSYFKSPVLSSELLGLDVAREFNIDFSLNKSLTTSVESFGMAGSPSVSNIYASINMPQTLSNEYVEISNINKKVLKNKDGVILYEYPTKKPDPELDNEAYIYAFRKETILSRNVLESVLEGYSFPSSNYFNTHEIDIASLQKNQFDLLEGSTVNSHLEAHVNLKKLSSEGHCVLSQGQEIIGEKNRVEIKDSSFEGEEIRISILEKTINLKLLGTSYLDEWSVSGKGEYIYVLADRDQKHALVLDESFDNRFSPLGNVSGNSSIYLRPRVLSTKTKLKFANPLLYRLKSKKVTSKTVEIVLNDLILDG